MEQIENNEVNKKVKRGWPKGKPRKIRQNKKEPSFVLENVINQLQQILDVVKSQDAKLSHMKKELFK